MTNVNNTGTIRAVAASDVILHDIFCNRDKGEDVWESFFKASDITYTSLVHNILIYCYYLSYTTYITPLLTLLVNIAIAICYTDLVYTASDLSRRGKIRAYTHTREWTHIP